MHIQTQFVVFPYQTFFVPTKNNPYQSHNQQNHNQNNEPLLRLSHFLNVYQKSVVSDSRNFAKAMNIILQVFDMDELYLHLYEYFAKSNPHNQFVLICYN